MIKSVNLVKIMKNGQAVFANVLLAIIKSTEFAELATLTQSTKMEIVNVTSDFMEMEEIIVINVIAHAQDVKDLMLINVHNVQMSVSH